MPLFRSLFALAVAVVSAGAAFAQTNIPLGQWRSHFSYTGARTVEQVGPRIYCGTSGGLFYYDTEDNSLHTLSKIEGFSDVGVQKIAHDTESNTTVIAYANTNIDLIAPDGRVHNINDILRKQIIGNKVLRSVHTANKLAYVSTSFGVVVIDLVKREVKNTYANIGPNGRVLDVYSVTTLNDSIYLAVRDAALTSPQKYRIMRARISNNNLLDYANWQTFTNDALLNGNNEPLWNLAAFNNKVYASANYAGIFYFNGSEWKQTSVDGTQDVFSLKVRNGQLLASTVRYGVPQVVNIQSPTSYTPITYSGFIKPVEAISTDAAEYWVADEETGLLHLLGTEAEKIIPNGPFSPIAFDMWSANGKVYVAGGSYNKASSYVNTGSRTGFYVFEEGEWKNFNPILITDRSQYPDVRDVVEIAQTPNGNLYLGTYGHGLVKWNGPGNFTIYDHTNSPLLNALTNPDLAYNRIAGLDVDAQGTLWIINRNEKNFGSAPSLFSLKPNGEWGSYTIPFAKSGYLEKMAIDDFGQKWIIASYNEGGGVVVFNEKTNRWRHLTESTSGGRLPSRNANSLTKDREGAMWVGTENGVGVYYSPSQILQPNYNVETRPLIDGRYLLENQVVYDIAVDGGNRKWIASEQGLWLVNETGTEVLQHFTTENSPLPQNKINKLVLNQETGELFIATDAGLVSYRVAATITETNNACTGVFPNPVRPGFTGTVGISGVPDNALVKITDLSGALVYEIKANGNTAAWNLLDYNGKRVQTGVYLVLSSSADGSQNFSCKIAVLE